MEIVKKFWVPIACGLVALLAIGLTFYPVNGWVSQVQTAVKDQEGLYDQLQGLLTKTRSLPNLQGGEAQPGKLVGFPTRTAIQKANEATATVAASAKVLLDAAVSMNAKKPLVAGALPTPSANDAFRFRDEYRRFVTTALPAKFGAVSPPGEAELAAEREAIWNRDYQPQIVEGPNGPLNEEEKRAEFDAATEDLAERLNRDWAARHRIYMEKDALALAPGIDGPTAPPAATIWAAQVLLWLQTDILSAIEAANQGSKSILDAPVKQIAQIAVGSQPLVAAPAADAADSIDLTAAPVATPPHDPIVLDHSVSHTGRTSHGLYDLYEVRLVLNVDSDRIPEILAALEADRLLYIRKVNVDGVDLEAAKAAGFYYGPGQVAQLDIDAEALLLRKWTEPFMPLVIRQQLGLPAADAEAGKS